MLQKRTSAAQMVVEAVASEESDPVATYMRDAMWYSRSYGLGSDEKVEKSRKRRKKISPRVFPSVQGYKEWCLESLVRELVVNGAIFFLVIG